MSYFQEPSLTEEQAVDDVSGEQAAGDGQHQQPGSLPPVSDDIKKNTWVAAVLSGQQYPG